MQVPYCRIPKYRRKVVYGQLRKDIGSILRRLCEYKGIEIVEGTACRDHIHLCLSIAPKHSVSSLVGYLKGKSAIEVFERHSQLRGNFRGHHFWAREYYVRTVALMRRKYAIIHRTREEGDRLGDSGTSSGDPFQ